MYRIYTVREGEKLLSISNRLGVNPDEIRKMNGFSADYEVTPGDQIIVPSVTISPFDNYVVQKGETLYGISQKYNLDVNDLARLNGLDVDDYIYPEQELIIPKSNISFYITNEGDTLGLLREKFPSDFDKILKNNQYIYLMPDQVLIFQKNNW